MVLKTEAVKRLLNHLTLPDLAGLYNPSMEVQINVAKDNGERVDGDYRGKKWHGFTDGLTTWKSFRIPFNAKSDPSYEDSELKFDLESHVEGIGMTGWDWKAKKSRWVAFDFDAIIGHSDKHTAKMTDEELKAVREAAMDIEWVTIRKSTSGSGLHLYVFIDSDAEVANHTEHAALARAILGKMSAIAGYSFDSKVDICGGNMWVWHRKMLNTDGLKLVKQGTTLRDVPVNWRDHINVISRKRQRIASSSLENIGKIDLFDELTGQHPKVNLDEEHKALLKYLEDNGKSWIWDQDNHMLITHTLALQEAFNELVLKGHFRTNSSGSSEINCFCFPMRKGAWSVRRYSPGVNEHPSWSQDGAGWTRTYLNRLPDLRSACLSFGGVEDPKGGYVFREAAVAAEAALLLGVDVQVAPALHGRKAKLKEHKDGRLLLEIDRDSQDHGEDAPNFLADKTKWTRIYNVKPSDVKEPEVNTFDDTVRHLVGGNGQDAGWVLKSDEEWVGEPINHIKMGLESVGLLGNELKSVLGACVFKAWKLVNKPFQDEYPGDRQWNRSGAKFSCIPSTHDDLKYDHWTKILNHCGIDLDKDIARHPWCKKHGIKTGGDYLKCWVASMIQNPYDPLPYLFFHSVENNTGKSIFHEAISLLFKSGHARADAALTNQQGFNGELEGVVLCVVEEIDMSQSKVAYSRIKDWVTGREMSIHHKGQTPYLVPNTAHWVQCSNPIEACPIFKGDSRITMINAKPIDPMDMIPKKRLIALLTAEAPDFIAELLRMDIPPSDDRLALPIIETAGRKVAEDLNMTPLEMFIREKCVTVPGSTILFSEFYDRFVNSMLQGEESRRWGKITVGRSMPPIYPKGRTRKDPNWHFGNIAWRGKEPEPSKPLKVEGDYLVEVDDD